MQKVEGQVRVYSVEKLGAKTALVAHGRALIAGARFRFLAYRLRGRVGAARSVYAGAASGSMGLDGNVTASRLRF